MLAIKPRAAALFETLYGPHRKRGERCVRVETKTGVNELSIAQAIAGTELLPGVGVNLSNGQMNFELPPQATLSRVKIVGREPLYKGSPYVTDQNKIRISIPADRVYSVTIGGAEAVIALSEKPAAVEGEKRSVGETLRDLVNKLFLLLLAISFHMAVLVLTGVVGMDLDLPWLESKNEVAVEEKQPEVTIPVNMTGTESDFAGMGLSLSQPQAAPTPEAIQKRTEKIASGLNSIVAKMAKLSLSGIAKVTGADPNSAGAASAVNAVQGRLGQGRDTDVKGNFKFVGQGSIGNTAKWDVYGNSGRQFSDRDLEMVAEAIRALQEQFRGCYENALLKFEALSVTVQFEGEVQKSGRIESPAFAVKGRSDNESESMLKSCMTKVMRGAEFNKRISGVKIRNQFIFKS